MKKLLKTTINPSYLDLGILIIRISVAIFMLVHGLPKLGRFFTDEEIKFANPIGLGVIPSLMLVVFAEVFCSLLIFIGLATRLAVIPLIITMLVIIFIVHGDDGFGKQELPYHYLVAYILLFITGSGRYSVDQLLAK